MLEFRFSDRESVEVPPTPEKFEVLFFSFEVLSLVTQIVPELYHRVFPAKIFINSFMVKNQIKSFLLLKKHKSNFIIISLLCKVSLRHHYFRSTHLRFHLANCKLPVTVFSCVWYFSTDSLWVIEPLLIPHETSRTIALELTSEFVTFEITSASQIIIEVSWHVCDTITIPWSSVSLA